MRFILPRNLSPKEVNLAMDFFESQSTFVKADCRLDEENIYHPGGKTITCEAEHFTPEELLLGIRASKKLNSTVIMKDAVCERKVWYSEYPAWMEFKNNNNEITKEMINKVDHKYLFMSKREFDEVILEKFIAYEKGLAHPVEKLISNEQQILKN